MSDLITLPRATVQQALEAWEDINKYGFVLADYEGPMEQAIAALRAALEQTEQEQSDQGGKTGWPPGLLQDDCRGLSKWLASKPDARRRVREAVAALEQPEQEPVGDSYADLFNALQRIETAAVFLPSFKITHEGGLEAVVQNIVDAIAALAQPEQEPGQEPLFVVDGGELRPLRPALLNEGDKLFTAPPRREWHSLTDTERAAVQYESFKRGLTPLEFMELHEAALKEKNHE